MNLWVTQWDLWSTQLSPTSSHHRVLVGAPLDLGGRGRVYRCRVGEKSCRDADVGGESYGAAPHMWGTWCGVQLPQMCVSWGVVGWAGEGGRDVGQPQYVELNGEFVG